jgi:hypothetical protein
MVLHAHTLLIINYFLNLISPNTWWSFTLLNMQHKPEKKKTNYAICYKYENDTIWTNVPQLSRKRHLHKVIWHNRRGFRRLVTQPSQQAILSLMRIVGEGKRDDCSTRWGNLCLYPLVIPFVPPA